MMLRYLDQKFWMRLILLTFLVAVMFMGPGIYRKPAQYLTFTDEVSTTAAAPEQQYSPTSGLSFELELELERYIEQLVTGPAIHDWRFLHQEWFALARQFFDRLYAEPAVYNTYVKLWLQKRKQAHDWRVSCRREFFPELDDRELFDKIDWLSGQEEWQEMQAKIHQGLEKIDHDYNQALTEHMGNNLASIEKLHQLFIQDHMKEESSAFYFL